MVYLCILWQVLIWPFSSCCWWEVCIILLLRSSAYDGLWYYLPWSLETWCLLVMSLAFVLWFFTAPRIIISSTAVVFLGRPVWCLFLGPPVVSFFCKTFQALVLDVPSFCAVLLNGFFCSLGLQISCFWGVVTPLVFMIVYASDSKCRWKQRLNPRLDTHCSFMCKQAIQKEKKQLFLLYGKTYMRGNTYGMKADCLCFCPIFIFCLKSKYL